MTRHVIIGTGIAGYTAAETLRTMDRGAEIVLVSDDPYGFYSRPGLAYYLTGEIPEKQLFLFSKKGKLNLDVEHLKGLVTQIDPSSHTININTSGKVAYDRLLLATGASGVPLDVPGATLQGLVKMDDLQDTRKILSMVRSTKAAVVVGGGVVAIELVEGLVARGVKVHYLLRVATGFGRMFSAKLNPAWSSDLLLMMRSLFTIIPRSPRSLASAAGLRGFAPPPAKLCNVTW